jgi:simple sugar transport system permease protein
VTVTETAGPAEGGPEEGTDAGGGGPGDTGTDTGSGGSGGFGSGGIGGLALRWLRSAVDALAVPTLALFSALVVGAIVILVSDPKEASWSLVWDSYHALFDSSLGSTTALGRTLVEATPLALAGLSVALAFRAGLFNIGGAGQVVVGATCAAWVGFTWDLPSGLHIPLAVLAGFLGGAGWGFIAGLLKARTGAHEVITTIMLNYIAYYLIDYALRSDAFLRPGRADPISKPVAESARLPEYEIGDLTVHAGLFIAIAAAILVWWLLGRSTVGFRMRAVGANPAAARYAGMSVGATYMLAMFLAGGLAGLAGAVNIMGQPSYSLTSRYSYIVGFDGIAVALLGRANPIGVMGAAFLFGVLRAGAGGMQAATRTPIDIIVVIQALIIMFVAAPTLVRAIYRVRAGRGTEQAFTTNWGA